MEETLNFCDMEWRTKEGVPITFTWQEDVERENRGWVVHELTVFVDGVKAGYLKTSYIPSENWDKFYPDITAFLDKIKGKAGVGTDDPDKKLQYLSHEVEPWHKWLNDKTIALMSDSEKAELKARYMAEVEERYGKEFQEHYDFHVDRPLVDFIHLDKEFRGRGIAPAMYYEVAQRLAEKGFVLYRSGVQTKGAFTAWEYMKEDPFLKTLIRTDNSVPTGEKYRDYLDLRPLIEEVVENKKSQKKHKR